MNEHTAVGLVLAIGLGASSAVHQLVSGAGSADALPLLGVTVGVLVGALGRQSDSVLALCRARAGKVGGAECDGSTSSGKGQETGSRGVTHRGGGKLKCCTVS